MDEQLRPALVSLSPAQRARTAVAACDAVRWPDADEPAEVPFVEQGGSLLLIVTDDQRQHLLDSGGGCMALDARSLGSVRLSGIFWPVADSAARDVLDEIRACHVDCLNCPSRRLTHMVGLQVDLVELQGPDGRYRRVDLHSYVQAGPDWVLAHGVQVREHLNTAHGEEVLEAASALAGLRTDQVLSAELEWIDGYGFDIAMIDESGGRQLRYEFPRPVVDPDRLSSTVHDCLFRATAPVQEPPVGDG